MVKLPPVQRTVLAHLFQNAPICDEAELLQFQLADTEGVFYAAYVKLKAESSYGNAYLVTSLASLTNRIYIAITVSHPYEVARALANLEDYDRVKQLIPGDTIYVPDSFFAAHGMLAVILLRPATMDGFDTVADSYNVEGRQLNFSLALFLSKDELQFKDSRGHDALMDRFDSEGRSLVVFDQEH